ncbi:hypothetical protein FFLO_00251 [Filobasidium floriforme]|uniref:Uncharacterized protein n=1 Tax=Filobasidium floriforme TaxID=5210 RepID=A0A8K0NTI3_9TREE|nr:uncharacterized protein HD553DRAFT_357788 [Filobasidium floriforme]KAG7575432.1 hypothetical protein FFLO_00251 [Filobasidium floriforme]KAH8082567.1 hypothetical protein HD553DRAFT_357788 [Filobasidium floriforme]
MFSPLPALVNLVLFSCLVNLADARSQSSAVLFGIKALTADRSSPANLTLNRRQSTQLCADNYCTSLDAPGLGALQKCKADDQPCVCQASQQLSSSCLSCHGNLSSITEIFDFYQECRLIPKPPTAESCRPLCSSDLSAVNTLSTCGSEDQGCICKGVDEIASLQCLNCIMYLGGEEYTATDVKQTCLLSSATLGTALRPSSTITPTSTPMSTSSQLSSSYPSEAITSTISIARPTGATTDTGTGAATESPMPPPSESAENGAVERGLVAKLALCLVPLLVIVCGLI